LVRVTPDLIFHRDALAQLRTVSPSSEKQATHFRPSFQELTGITRQYAIRYSNIWNRRAASPGAPATACILYGHLAACLPGLQRNGILR